MQPRFVALLALALVLYVVASLGAAGAALDAGAMSLSVVAGASALGPLWLPRHGAAGERLVALLGAAQALALGAVLLTRAHLLAGELLSALSLSGMGALLVRLALCVPDRPPRLVRERRLTPLALGVSGLGALLGVLSAVPPNLLAGHVAPHAWSMAPTASLVACFGVASWLRLARARLGSDARALAGNAWATVGSCAALVAATTAVLLRTRHPGAADAALALAAVALLLGHALAVVPAWAPVAAPRLRALSASFAALALAALLVAPLGTRLEVAPLVLGVALAVCFALLERLLARVLGRVLAPEHGALLEAVREARREAPLAGDVAELAARVLRPLRRAAKLPEAAPLLVTFDPPRTARLDAAGHARLLERPLPTALTQRLERTGEPLVTLALRALLPRRPELDPLLKALSELDALCVLPLHARGEPEGALLVARGGRAAALTLEELEALGRLADELAPLVAGKLALERSMARVHESEAQVAILTRREQEQADGMDALRDQVSAVKAALGQPLPERDPVQYSEAMRALGERLSRAAPQDLPMLLWGESGLALAPLAQSLHRASGRAAEPFIIVDCATLTTDAAAARLFGLGGQRGSAAQPGLLSLVAGGTLLLADLPALPEPIQRALVRVLEERRAYPLGSNASYAFEGRIVASARRSLRELAEAGFVIPELARWLEATCHRVPPLRERPEDLESLLLLALDRAARVLGSEPKGVEADALALLLAYDWPGNDAELISVIERAVERTAGARITIDDLPWLAVEPPRTVGASFVEQERAILRRALRKAGGSRTRAASALGLRRSELVEKLRALELDDATSAEN